MRADVLNKARELLRDITPLNTDCGPLCARACCRDDINVGNAVALFPGEEAGYDGLDWARVSPMTLPVSGLTVFALNCTGSCERDKRPLCCRIFPLTLRFSKLKGRWTARVDRRAHMMCPLAMSGVKGLKPEFVSAVNEAGNILAADKDGERTLKALAAEEKAYHISLT